MILLAGLVAGAASAEAWDHRGMQSHHRSTPPVEPALGEGETRFGRITIGASSASHREIPDTLEHTTQRQWQQRRSFSDSTLPPSVYDAPSVSANRYDATRRRPGASSSTGGSARSASSR
jgi:hypothetical protein